MKIPLIHRLEASHTYGPVLCLIMLSLVFASAVPDGRGSRLGLVVLQACTLLLTLWTSRTPERDFRWALVGVTIAMAASVALALSHDPRLFNGAVAIISGLVILVVPAVIAHGVVYGIREQGAVTFQEVFGVLSVYLLIGMLFAFAFGAVAELHDGSLFTDGTDGNLQEHMYFSFTTLTTVGYGDLAPAGEVARTFSFLEALIGQLYLVTVVAVLVGNLAGRRRG